MALLGSAGFGVVTFPGDASGRPTETYGPNGLPMAPPSIRIMGRFQRFMSMESPNLVKYLDIIRGKYDQVYVIAEHHIVTLRDVIDSSHRLLSLSAGAGISIDTVELATQIVRGVAALHRKGLTHRCLTLDNVLIANDGVVKLTNYCLYTVTKFGEDVNFPIGVPKYFPPEVLCAKSRANRSGPKSDVWALGIVLVELCLRCEIWKGHPIRGWIQRLLNCVRTSKEQGSILSALLRDIGRSVKEIPPSLAPVIEKCLMIIPSKRPSANQLLEMEVFSSIKSDFKLNLRLSTNLISSFRSETRNDHFTSECLQQMLNTEEDPDLKFPLGTRPIEEVYALWKLAGSDVESILTRKGIVKTNPPILILPNLVVDDNQIFGHESEREVLVDLNVVPLSMDNLTERLSTVHAEEFFPVLELKYALPDNCSVVSLQRPGSLSDCSTLPTVIKERDIQYQLKRQIIFELLVSAYPYKKSLAWREARVDIPPLYRRFVWAALLDVKGDTLEVYRSIDKDTPTATDRQIEVDIPRCHQYDELLSSPEGHAKFKRILKAWVISNPSYVYWQGLDSLSAPFLHLNFADEELAFACLSAFIPKYLFNFFLKDNSTVIHEYLAIFNHLIAYHEPKLYMHLREIGFMPELYAIPWFLTMFSHVFPMQKIFHLWDTLLLGSHSFPICVGVAILRQLRDRLLTFCFNDCILLFSDLPEVDIEQCVQDSVAIFCNTPKSATVRSHAPPAPASVRDRRAHSASFVGYDVDTMSELGIQPLPINLLKVEVSPRICASELMGLCGLKSEDFRTASDETAYKITKTSAKILPIDIRPFEEFAKGTFPNAINIPYASLNLDSDDLVAPLVGADFGSGALTALPDLPAVRTLTEHRGRMVVVIGSKSNSAAKFSEHLVRHEFPRVSILHNGIEVFLHTDVLTLPPMEL